MSTSRTTNSAGWEVQSHSMPVGWVGISKAYSTFHEARAEMLRMEEILRDEDHNEWRVYESLKAVS